MCPRGDLNPHSGEISPNLGLNSKTGEKSPDRGVHAVRVAGAPRLASSAFRRLAAERGLLYSPDEGLEACRAGRRLRHARRGAPACTGVGNSAHATGTSGVAGMRRARSALLGSLFARTGDSRRAELDVLHAVTDAAQLPC
jgi:hypothetical protein